ncbi:hypothetical protein [Emticicia sp. 17c]|uniref:hypothetical protein n=1 Tax=Emticicia sp. 17c TaxID=3127704 RepID=UPI00301B757E
MRTFFLTMFWGILSIACFSTSFAQSVTIDPNTNATGIIDASSTTKGFLMPRMSEIQRNAITGLLAGTQVYCTNCAAGIGAYAYNGSVWVPMFNTSSIMYAVGQAKQGGIVFYVDDSGQHGLVVATIDCASGTTFKWISASNINTNAVRSGVYGGQYNTELINEIQGSGSSAAMAAAQFTDGTYGDWYLPSKGELAIMYQQRANIGMGSVTNTYWSSTEVPVSFDSVSETAITVNFSGGAQTTSAKSNTFKVRAIRRF